MSEKEKNIAILKKTNIRDLISETLLLTEFSAYGCPKETGKVYGYNPFTKKCVDITNYQGPTTPIAAPTVDPDSGSITQIFTSPTGLIRLLYDVYVNAFSIEQMTECVKDNPLLTGLGYIVGQTSSGKSIVMSLPRVAVKMLTPSGVSQGVQMSMEKSQALETYKMQHKGIFRELGESFLKFLKTTRGKIGTGIAVAVSIALGGYGSINLFNDYQTKKDIMGFWGWTEQQLIGDESLDNAKCFGAAMVLSVALGALGRAGTSGLFKIAGKSTWKTVSAPYKIMKAMWRSDACKNLWVKIISASLKGKKTKNLNLFQALQNAKLVPDDVKIVLEKSDGKSTLKVQNLSNDIVISKDRVPDALKKYSSEQGIVLKKSDLEKELFQVSDDINQLIIKEFQGNAKTFKNSAYRRQLKLFKETLEKYGQLSTLAIKSKAFENSIELIVKMHKEADVLAEKISKLEIELIADSSKVKSTLQNLSSGTKLPDFRKVELDVIKRKDVDIKTIISENYPNLDTAAPDAFKQVENYFSKHRAFESMQEEIISQLSVGRIALIDETRVLKEIVGEGKKTRDFEKWLSSEAGSEWSKHWNSFPSKRQRIVSKLGSKTSKALKDAFTKFLSNEDLIISAYAIGASILANSVSTKVEDVQELEDIILFLDKQVQILVNNNEIENYYDQNFKFKSKEFLLKLTSKLKERQQNFSNNSKKAIEEWNNAIKNNKEYIAAIDKFYNRQDDATILSITSIKIRTKALTRAALDPKGTIEKAPSKEKVKVKKQANNNLMSQIPDGDLKQKSPFSLKIGTQQVQASFTNEYFEIGNKRFKFNDSIGGDATIDSVSKSGGKISAKLSVGLFSKNFTLSDRDLQILFSKANSLSQNAKVQVKLGTESGNIIRIKEYKGVSKMNKKDIKQMVSEFLNENSGMGYQKYPYSTGAHSESEPDEDYMIEWNALIDEVCGPRKKNVDGDPKTIEDAAVEVAKILVKDSDLFRDVLELSGANKSLGTEILRQVREAKERKNLDDELKV